MITNSTLFCDSIECAFNIWFCYKFYVKLLLETGKNNRIWSEELLGYFQKHFYWYLFPCLWKYKSIYPSIIQNRHTDVV